MTTTAYTPGLDEKLVPTMIYTNQKVIWGLTVIKKIVRVSTWLQTDSASKYMDLVDTQILLFGGGRDVQWLKFPLLHLETKQVIAYHTLPPTDESPYSDPNDPHRKMEPATVLVGVFQFDCMIRMAENYDMETFLRVKTGQFLPIYNATMTCPLLSKLKPVQTPFALIKRDNAIFCERSLDNDREMT